MNAYRINPDEPHIIQEERQPGVWTAILHLPKYPDDLVAESIEVVEVPAPGTPPGPKLRVVTTEGHVFAMDIESAQFWYVGVDE